MNCYPATLLVKQLFTTASLTWVLSIHVILLSTYHAKVTSIEVTQIKMGDQIKLNDEALYCGSVYQPHRVTGPVGGVLFHNLKPWQ
jgi:hypothetical protein